MASNALTNVKNNAIIAAKNNDDALVAKKSSGGIIKKDYILNDLEALKKKLDNEYLSPGIQITNEAVSGASTTIRLKTSLFEYAKCYLMETLKQDERIIKAEAVKKVVADTNFHGEADVEFQLEILFKIRSHQHKVKILCFTTTCKMMVQLMGEAPEIKEYLGNKSVTKYFSEHFLISFGEQILATNPNIDDTFIPKLKEEMKRLQQLFYQSKKKNLKPLPKSIKCGTYIKCKKGGTNQKY